MNTLSKDIDKVLNELVQRSLFSHDQAKITNSSKVLEEAKARFEELPKQATKAINLLILEFIKDLPDLIKEVYVSGVAVPREEMHKISLQDLRLVLLELAKKKLGEK